MSTPEGVAMGPRGPQPDPSNGSVIAAAEAEGLMEVGLSVAYVQASPEDDDDHARTAHQSTGGPGESGWQQPTELRSPSNMGTQETPAELSRVEAEPGALETLFTRNEGMSSSSPSAST